MITNNQFINLSVITLLSTREMIVDSEIARKRVTGTYRSQMLFLFVMRTDSVKNFKVGRTRGVASPSVA